MKTTFANDTSPWAHLTVPNVSKKAKEKSLPPRQKPSQVVEKAPNVMPAAKLEVKDIGLAIVNDKPKPRRVIKSKYDDLFSKLKPGQAIKCSPRDAHAIANAMRAWHRRRNLGWSTAMTEDYGDGYARVFRTK